MKRTFFPSTAAILQLFTFANSWSTSPLPCYRRGSLRCKTQALIYLDRMATKYGVTACLSQQ